jgi:hypothetical protein
MNCNFCLAASSLSVGNGVFVKNGNEVWAGEFVVVAGTKAGKGVNVHVGIIEAVDTGIVVAILLFSELSVHAKSTINHNPSAK